MPKRKTRKKASSAPARNSSAPKRSKPKPARVAAGRGGSSRSAKRRSAPPTLLMPGGILLAKSGGDGITEAARPGDRRDLPVLPVRQTVLFPFAILPLTIGRPTSVQL